MDELLARGGSDEQPQNLQSFCAVAGDQRDEAEAGYSCGRRTHDPSWETCRPINGRQSKTHITPCPALAAQHPPSDQPDCRNGEEGDDLIVSETSPGDDHPVAHATISADHATAEEMDIGSWSRARNRLSSHPHRPLSSLIRRQARLPAVEANLIGGASVVHDCSLT